ncbi:MAG: hypothetical protein LBT29_02945 [Flavobacteriaceae bacterium]|jgi:hypothetical protein|nr:hypothetical protein [Flavobacteriaceae bacterium]
MEINEQFQKEVFEDFKLLINDLSKIRNFSGLLVHQQKIQNMYEKYIFLKQMNTFKYQQVIHREIVEQAEIPEKDFIPEIQPEISQPEPETPPILEEEEEKVDVEAENAEDSEIPEKDFVPEIQPEISQSELETPPILEEEEKVNVETENVESEEVGQPHFSIDAEKIEFEKEKLNLSPVQPDLNDSIDFISRLFKGKKSVMDEELEKLNETQNLAEARAWTEEMFHKYQWKGREEYVERLSGLILKRFE